MFCYYENTTFLISKKRVETENSFQQRWGWSQELELYECLGSFMVYSEW